MEVDIVDCIAVIQSKIIGKFDNLPLSFLDVATG